MISPHRFSYPYPEWFDAAPDKRLAIEKLVLQVARAAFFGGDGPARIRLQRLLLVATFRCDPDVFLLVRPCLPSLALHGVGKFGPTGGSKKAVFPCLIQHACAYGDRHVQGFLATVLTDADLASADLKPPLLLTKSPALMRRMLKFRALGLDLPFTLALALSTHAARGSFDIAGLIISAAPEMDVFTVGDAVCKAVRAVENYEAYGRNSQAEDWQDPKPEVRDFFAVVRKAGFTANQLLGAHSDVGAGPPEINRVCPHGSFARDWPDIAGLLA